MKTNTSILLASVLSAATTSIAAPILNPANGHYYDVFYAGGTWDTANSVASGMSYDGVNGHLATITSASENQFIVDNFASSYRYLWLGGFQAAGAASPTESWQWVTGESWSFTDWGTGEPNDFGGTDENRLAYWQTIPGWVDLAPDAYLPVAVIEYEHPSQGVPDGGSTLALLGVGVFGLVASKRRQRTA